MKKASCISTSFQKESEFKFLNYKRMAINKTVKMLKLVNRHVKSGT